MCDNNNNNTEKENTVYLVVTLNNKVEKLFLNG